MKTILDLSPEETKSFFLKQENFCSIDLPNYFDFQSLLNALSCNRSISSSIALDKAKKYNDTNYTFYTNKDGKLAWRPLEIINPVIYVNLVSQITADKNWNHIIKRFKEFKENKNIQCFSIPIVADHKVKGKTIMNWWQKIEQQSLEFALDYDCFMQTDISDCYSSIYTHSIPWALHGTEEIKISITQSKKDNSLIGNKIDTIIQAMRYSQTNGIPQGSIIMDFIAEMVLGYADLKLTRKINHYNQEEDNYKICDYKILRYRDDYRIFSNNQQTVVKIGKLLSEALSELNLKLNSHKTFISGNIISDVLKPDKSYWIQAKQNSASIQKQLLIIHSLSEKYPNSGSLIKALTKFLEEKIHPLKLFKEENSKVLISILLDIAFKNPKTYPVITAIMSKILSIETDPSRVSQILQSIENKFDKVPNVGHLQIWLQRLTLKTNRSKEYSEKLCKKLNNTDEKIWNIDWINPNIVKIFKDNPIIDETKIKDLESVIEPNEVTVFSY